ncbi:uncharacterized protein CBL_04472 [Carabus blaptoides fortunei]
MCKCIQSCFESCYWHCIEKWLCYDETIATYEDPLPQEKDPRVYDNIAFWDSVAVIANRSIVTVQPLPQSTKPADDNHKQPNIVTNPPKPPQNELNTSTDSEDSNRPNIIVNSPDSDKSQCRKKSAIEEKIEKSSETFCQERNRKKSLKERRKSAAGLTLKLQNDFHEIPVIRQNSMPKFYLDTPELGTHRTYGSDRSSVLVSPVLPNSPTFNYDLRSVVQMEKEHYATMSKPATPRSNRSSRLTNVRKKLKPMLSKKASSKSLPDGINHV